MEWGSEVRAGNEEVVGRRGRSSQLAGYRRSHEVSMGRPETATSSQHLLLPSQDSLLESGTLCLEGPIQLLAQGTIQSAPMGEHAPS